MNRTEKLRTPKKLCPSLGAWKPTPPKDKEKAGLRNVYSPEILTFTSFQSNPSPFFQLFLFFFDLALPQKVCSERRCEHKGNLSRKKTKNETGGKRATERVRHGKRERAKGSFLVSSPFSHNPVDRRDVVGIFIHKFGSQACGHKYLGRRRGDLRWPGPLPACLTLSFPLGEERNSSFYALLQSKSTLKKEVFQHFWGPSSVKNFDNCTYFAEKNLF